MNPLSAFAAGLGALASTGKKSSYSDPSSEPDAGQDQFARMLNPANTPNQAPPQAPERVPAKQAAPKPNQPDRQRSDDDHGDDAPGDATARPRAQDGDAKAAKAGAKEPAAADGSSAAGSAKTGKPTTNDEDAPADAATATDPSWPPPGLGGFGMGLLTQALPGGDVLAAAAAALAAGVTAAAGTTPTATALPTDAAAPAAPSTAGTALPALGALAPAAATGAKPTSVTALSGDAQAAALMSMASKALEPGTDDSAGPAAPDAPAFVLQTTTATALGRLQDPAPVFSASPTPTPTPDMGSDSFDDAIGARMSWLADQKIGHAHIKVTPNEMGPVEVRLHLDGDKVNASFSSANADVRQALEQSLPRLREMLGQNGFQLGQADVGQQQQSQSGNRNGGGSDGNGLSLDDSPPVGIPSVVLRQRGLLDAYA
ncbi:flagellar protein [Xanthomonas arboricola pv. juglandis]|uniref:flagellar hook-length control protein FliK n=1 Tax=Xanthomonas TaxID=338 RepID=UPI000E5AB661|nr:MULTISPECIES: flagellar hook-length control protein FliK [Xanthomonas]CAD1791539.1 flagellar hook-length control protein FliK [Xanthomonas sp. CPBF 426]CAG2089638.1 flagellar hook-length control protein FliK [Xanthomonas euroxanthea]SYZ53052.1 flagellar protein [Xanthomonas arboricola pv. juglandis]